VDDAYQIFFTKHYAETDKRITTVHAVTDNRVTPADPEVTAFRPQQKKQPQNNQQGSGN
jgi:hypothetical protein